MQTLLAILRRPAVVRISIALYVLCLCVLIFIYFVISAMQVPTAIYLRGPEALAQGEPLVLRGHVLDVAMGQKLRNIKEIRSSLSCPHSGQDLALPSPEFEPDGELHLNHTLDQGLFPADEPQACELKLALRREANSPLFESSSTLTLLPVKARARAAASTSWPTLVERRPRAKEADTERLARLGVTRETLLEQGEREGAHSEQVRIDLVERYPVLGRGLPGHVTLRTTDRESGAPRACEIIFKATRGILDGEAPARAQTDRLGLARIALTPSTLQVWDLEAFCDAPSQEATQGQPGAQVMSEPTPDGSARVQIDVATTQFQFARHKLDPLILEGSRELVAGFSSIYKEGWIVVDHYRGEEHLYTGRHGFQGYQGGVRVQFFEGHQGGLHRVQIYQDAYQPGTAWDILHVWRARPPQGENETALEQAIADLIALHLEHDRARGLPHEAMAYLSEHAGETWRAYPVTSQRKLFEALLHGLPPTFAHAPLLLNSFDEDQRQLDAWKQSIRHELLLAVAAALLTGLAMLSLAILSGISQRQARQRLYEEVELEHGAHDEAHDEEAALAMQRRQRAEKIMLWVQGGVLFGTLVVFAACIWMLMRFMM